MGSPLCKVVNDGLSKPAHRGDGTLALLAAVNLASADSEAYKTLQAEKVWQELAKPETVFLSAVAVARLPSEEAASSASLAQMLLIKVSAAVSLLLI